MELDVFQRSQLYGTGSRAPNSGPYSIDTPLRNKMTVEGDSRECGSAAETESEADAGHGVCSPENTNNPSLGPSSAGSERDKVEE